MTDQPSKDMCRFGRMQADQWGRVLPCRNPVTGTAPTPDRFIYGFADGWESDKTMWPACTRHSRERAIEILGEKQWWAMERLSDD